MSIKFLPLKRAVRTALLVLLLNVVGLTNAMAQSFTVGNLNYSVNSDGVSVTLTGHVDGTSATGPLVIPESVTYNGTAYSVTMIGYMAFRNNTGLTGNLVIPNSVTNIGTRAFQSCIGFTGVLTIGTSLTTTGSEVFEYCSGLTEIHYNAINCEDSYSVLSYCDGLHTLVIGDNVERIPGGWFSGRAFTGSLTIPNSVTSIGESAFQGCSGFTGSLTIPNSVTSIGQYAFSGCSGFTGSLTIGNSVTIINAYAFSGCSGFTGTLTIPNSVTKIYNRAFQNCTGFTGSLVIPNSVTWLSGFNGCTGFSGSLVIPNSVDTIGGYAFQGCTGFIGSLTLGNSVNRIGLYAFKGCTGFLGVLNIPNSVTSIGQHAFESCSGFWGSLTIPNSVTSIEESAFSGCDGFTGSLTIGNSVTTIGGYAFYGCDFTGSLTIPNSVTTIGGGAFAYCDGFTGGLTIGNSVTTIGDSAFRGCSGFTGSLNIPNSVTSIGQYAFESCSGFWGSLTIPNSLTTIGGSAFRYCSGFTEDLTIPNSVTTIGSGAFYGCNGFTGSLTIPNSVTSIGNSAFEECSGFTGNLTIPNSVTSIGYMAFKGCSGFTGDLVIPNSLFTIKYNAFDSCSGLTGLTIGNSVVTIEEGAFSSCSGFTGALVIPNSVISIGRTNSGSGAFQNCSGFTSLVLGESLMTIAGNDFRNCTGFTEIYSNNTTPPLINMNNTFSNFSVPVYVPCGSETDYQAATGWNNFTEIMGLCAGTVTVEANPAEGGTVAGGGYYESGTQCTVTAVANEGFAFANWTKNGVVASTNATYTFPVAGDMTLVANFLQDGNIVFADANVKAICVEHWDTNGDGELSYVEAAVVTSLEYYFRYNEEITSFDELQYFIGLNSIGNETFAYCSGLTSIVLPSSLTTIGGWAFFECSGLTTIALPNTLLSIGYAAFYACNGLTSIVLPSSLANIGEQAFLSCDNIQSITSWGVTPPIISYNTFSGLYDKQLIVPCDAIEVYQNADYWSDFTNIVGMCGGTVTVEANPAEGGTVAGGGYYESGTQCTVTAVANEGFAFANWTKNGVVASTNATYTFPVAGDMTLVANFLQDGNIVFADANVKAICVEHWDTNGDGELSYVEAASVSSLEYYFEYNEAITSFDELQYFIGLNSIGDYAFYYCSGLTSIVLPSSVTNIGNSAFYYCSSLTSIVLPSSMTTIGNNAFRYCSDLQSIISLATTPPVISGYYTFSGYGLLLFVPCGTLEAYQNANYWSNFTNILPGTSNYIIQDGLRYEITSSNPPQAKLMGFAEGTTAAENLVIPASINSECPELNYAVTAIADSAFYNCNSLTGTLTLPESMTTIGNRTFFNAGLTGDLVIPENIVIIGPQTFAYCGFSSLHFNATDCVSIGLNDEGTWNFAFWNCTQLEEIVVGDNVTQIPIYAFANTNAQNCRVDLGAGVATINNYAFYNGTNNPTYSIKGALVIPASVGTIGYCAFYGCSGLTEIWSKRPSAPYIQFNTFTDVDNSIPVHVPCGSTSSYQYSNYWSAFTNYVENPAVLIARSNNELLGMATVTKYGDCGDNVSIVQAMPYMGAFASWTTPDGTVVSTNATYTFALTQDMILTANFEPMPNVNAFVGGGSTNHWDDPNNWLTNELPTAISTVSILADVEVNVDACVQGLTVYGNNVVTIAPDAQLTVAGTLESSSASSIVVEDGGQLVHTNDGVLATVKRIVTPYTVGEHDGWHLIASPLTDEVLATEVQNMTAEEYDLYYYDEPTVYWINNKDADNNFNTLGNGIGYLYGNKCLAPDEAQVGNEDNTTNKYFPFYTLYENGISESLFLVDELENAGLGTTSMTSISWYATTSTGYLQSNISIWMANVNESGLTSTSHNISGMTLVYTGAMTPEIGWNEFVFNEDGFAWDGVSNVLICVQRNNGAWQQNPINWQSHYCGFYGTTYSYRDYTPYDMATETYGMTTSTVRANTIFKALGGQGESITISFMGELRNGSATVNVPLLYTTGHALQGFNLVGNPFAHNVTSYASENVANGCYVMNEAKDDLIVSEISEENPLKPAEGFFVKATAEGASITFNPSRGSTATQSGAIRVELVENDKLIDRLLVKTAEGQPLEKFSLNERRTRLFAQGERQELAIVPCESNEQAVNFKAAKNGQYTISVNADGMDFDYLHLIDNLTGTDVDLLSEPSYTFEAKTSDYASRFLLRFIPKDGFSTSSETFAFISNGNIIITDADANATLQIVDVTGRVVVSSDAARNVSTSGMSAGVYVLRLINGNDVRTQKIVVE